MFKNTVKQTDIWIDIHTLLTSVNKSTLVQAFQLLGVLAALTSTVDLAEPFLDLILLMLCYLIARSIGAESVTLLVPTASYCAQFAYLMHKKDIDTI